MTQAVFGSKGTVVEPKCIDCDIILAIYSYWDGEDGPLCVLCYKKRSHDIKGEIS